jgi:membrane protein
MRTQEGIGLVKQTFSEWTEDKAPRLGAALAYYAVFSIPPLLFLVIAIIGLVYHGDVAGAIQSQLGSLIGESTARTMMETGRQQKTGGGFLPAIVGIALLLFGASGVFGELQDALNTIWGVKPKEGRGVTGIIKDRFLSLTMVLGIAFLLLVSLVLSAAVSAIGGWLPGGEALGHVIELALSFGITTLLFAMIFKVLPDVKLTWSDVWIGAFATAALFTIGKFAIGVYLGKGSIGSSYGAAGSVIVMIAWIYYSAQILFLGAEFTQVYANRYGSRVRPSENAEPIPEANKPTSEEARVPRPVLVRRQAMPDTTNLGVAAFATMLVGFLIGRKTHADRSRETQEQKKAL